MAVALNIGSGILNEDEAVDVGDNGCPPEVPLPDTTPGDDEDDLTLVVLLLKVPPTAPPTTAPMITKATIMPMTILPVFVLQNGVVPLSSGFSLRRSYELDDFPVDTTFPCSMSEPCGCESAGAAGAAAPGGVDKTGLWRRTDLCLEGATRRSGLYPSYKYAKEYLIRTEPR